MLRNPFRKTRRKEKPCQPANGRLEADLAKIKEAMGGESTGAVIRFFSEKLCLIYISVLVDDTIISRDILAYLPAVQRGEITLEQIPVGDISKTADATKAAQKILKGHAALIHEGSSEIFIYDTRGVKKRNIDEPPIERTTRGSRTGFIEDIETNISLVRRTINTPSLEVEYLQTGTMAVSRMAILYVKSVASPNIVNEVRHRLKNIKVDDVLATGLIENHMEDHPWSLFPQAYGTEKPNRVVANLLEGRVAVMLDGTPYVLLVPALFNQFLQGAEDYFERFWVANFTRLLRYIGLVLAITITPIYISLVTYHHELIPMELLLAIIEQRREAPFPPIMEALLMELIIEMLREAGLRLPNPLGQTMGVVGGIILGQAIIQANLVGPLVIIVVSISAVASFTIPNYSASLNIRLAKFPLILLAGVFGAFGISVGMLLFITHQAAMQSFGVPYMSPLAPTRYKDIGDSFVVSHIWKMKNRPVSIPHRKEKRVYDSPQEHHKK